MTEIFTSFLLLAYAAMGLVAIFAFGPTIKDLWLSKAGVNSTTYLLWLSNAVIGSLYALFIVGDFVMLLVSSLYALCCCMVLSLNWRYQRRMAVEEGPIKNQNLTLVGESLV